MWRRSPDLHRIHGIRRGLAAALLAGAVLAGCGGSDDVPGPDAAPDTTDIAVLGDEATPDGPVGHSEAVQAPPLDNPALAPLVELWMQAGADETLAVCYAEVLDSAGLAEQVADLNDLAEAQGSFTADQAEEFAACSNPE